MKFSGPEYDARLKKDREAIEKKTGRTPEQLYEERERRIRDSVALREPDRVPVSMGGGYFVQKYTGVPAAAAYYDIASYREATKKTILDFEPDMGRGGVTGAASGEATALLDVRQTRWPGGNLPANSGHQFVEGEYMKAEEYDLFLTDPSDFTIRFLLPRVFGTLAPLAKFPPITNLTMGTAGVINLSPFLAGPEFERLAALIKKAGEEQAKWRDTMATFDDEMAALGFPPYSHGMAVGASPFDAVSDFLRGMRGAMLDMYRCPDKLLAASEKILDWRIARAVPADPKKRGDPKRISMPLHRGAEGFMSIRQFEKFYWPTLKRAIQATVDLGYVAMPFFEGHFGDRLEYLLELPKGRVIAHFEHTDMKRAKEVLGKHICIMGNVPSSLLQVSSVQEVEEHCQWLIKTCGKGGGFILSPGSSIDEAKPENIKAMMEAPKKFRA